MVNGNTAKNSVAKSFKSPLFLVIAILVSVIFASTLIAALLSSMGLLLILGLVFSGISTVFAWLLYATDFSGAKLKTFRLYFAYRKIMTTILTVLVYILGILLILGCLLLTLAGDFIKNEVVPMLETDVKPMLEEIVASADQFEADMADLEEIFNEMPPELKEAYGIETPEDYGKLITDASGFARTALDAWDDVIKFFETGFAMLTVIVTIVVVILIVGLTLVGKAFKKTSKYIRALAEGNYYEKKAPFVLLFVGGGFIAAGSLLSFGIDALSALIALAEAASLILFALFFKQLNDELNAPVAAAPIVEEAPVEEAPVEEAPVEEAPVEEAPVEEAPVEEAPVEEAPVEEAPVEEAPVEDAPVEDAPVEDAPVEN